MQYKLSKYNYMTSNKNNEILLYNTYTGVNSFLKIAGNPQSDIHMALSGEKNVNTLSDTIKETLKEKGFIVPIDEDEFLKLKLLRFFRISSSDLHLIILPTEQCNFRCRYCYESFRQGIMPIEVQDHIIEYVSKNISRFKSLSISWFGGEPLLGMSVIENLSEKLLDICKRNRKPYTANITTNGYLLDYDTLQKLKKYHVSSYQITIDGLSNTHDYQKPLANGGKTFSTIIKNLEEIRDREKSRLLSFVIRTNISKDILADINEYIDFFSSKFKDDNRFSFFLRPIMDLGGERVESFQENMIKEDSLEIAFSAILKFPPHTLSFAYYNFLNPTSGICYASYLNSFVITPLGKILKCTCNLEDPLNEIGMLQAGGNMELHEPKYAMWLHESGCGNSDCFFAPNCLMESCPATRVIHHTQTASCPHEKTYLSSVLRILDAQNGLFPRLEDIQNVAQ